MKDFRTRSPIRLAAMVSAAIAFSALGTQASAQDAAPLSQPVTETAAADAAPEKEKMICRRESVIGSRAKKRKVCLTQAQWAQAARDGNAFARSVVESGRSGMWDVPPG